MVIIKIYSQDMYVAGLVSMNHTQTIADLLEIDSDDIYLVASDGALVYRGVDQTGWFTYLEVGISASLFAKHRASLEALLHKIFNDYGVHLLIKFDLIDEENITKIIDPNYETFNDSSDGQTFEKANFFDDDDDDEETDDYKNFVFDSFFDEDDGDSGDDE